jgi:beta-phosphoglucomutase
MYHAVIFDWDGTLADTRKAIVQSFHQATEEANLQVTSEYIERRIGIGAAETFRDILRSANKPVDETTVARLVEHKSELEIELTDQINLFAGARELLEALQSKVKVALASMNNRSVIRHLVEANNLTKYFQTILTAESITRSKPDPEIFLKAAEELEVKPELCVVLEDSIFGVKAAKAAGMGCVAVTTGVYSKAELQKALPDLVIESLQDGRVVPFILG